jgi:uncharacterized protein
MPKSIFTTLPTNNLEISIKFYQALGMSHNLDWSDESTACMQYAENIFFMITASAKFKSFIDQKSVIEPKTSCGAIHTFQLDSKEEVDELVKKATDNGGTAKRFSQDPSYDSWMYNFSVEDPDGNNLEIMYMDLVAMAQAFPQ